MIFEISIYFLLLATAVLSYGLIVAWSRRTRWLRWVLVVGACLSLPAAYLGIYDLLSRPKPVSKELAAYYIQEVEVLAFSSVPNKALYLWLSNEEFWGKEPRYFVRPWSKETKKLAGELQRAFREKAKKGGGDILLKNPFASSLEDEEPEVQHKLPWPKPPSKDAPSQRPRRPDQPGFGWDKPKKFEV